MSNNTEKEVVPFKRITPAPEEKEFNEPVSNWRYLEAVELYLISKYSPEQYQDSVFRIKSAIEREVKKLVYDQTAFSKEDFLDRLRRDIETIPFKPQNPSHHGGVHRPGSHRRYEQEFKEAY